MNKLFLKIKNDWEKTIKIKELKLSPNWYGYFNNNFTNKNLEIGINSNPNCDHLDIPDSKHQVIAHELGHYIDNCIVNITTVKLMSPIELANHEQKANFYALILANEYKFFDEFIQISVKNYTNWGQLENLKRLNECAEFFRAEFNLEAIKKAA